MSDKPLETTVVALMSYFMTVLLAIGGLVGFIKTGSVPSIVSGIVFAAWYFFIAQKLSSRKNSSKANGLLMGRIASVLLALVMFWRWQVTNAPVPLVIMLVSALVAFKFFINNMTD